MRNGYSEDKHLHTGEEGEGKERRWINNGLLKKNEKGSNGKKGNRRE